MSIPRLIEGLHYVVTDESPVMTIAAFDMPLTKRFPKCTHLMRGRHLVATLHQSRMQVYQQFHSDGYSPVIKKPRWIPGKNRWIRLTPVPSCGLAPALGHDILRMFLDVPGCDWDREYTDDEFFNWLELGGEKRNIAGAYHEAVAGVFGTIYIATTRKPDPTLSIHIRK